MRNQAVFSFTFIGTVFLIVLLMTSLPADALWKVTVGGETVSEELGPISTTDGFIVPFEFAALWGAHLTRDSAGYTIESEDKWITLYPGSRHAISSEGPYVLSTAPTLVGRTLYVPLQFFADFFDLRLKWNWAHNTVDIGQWASMDAGQANRRQVVQTIGDALNLIEGVRYELEGGSDQPFPDFSPSFGERVADATGIAYVPVSSGGSERTQNASAVIHSPPSTSNDGVQLRHGTREVEESGREISDAIARLLRRESVSSRSNESEETVASEPSSSRAGWLEAYGFYDDDVDPNAQMSDDSFSTTADQPQVDEYDPEPGYSPNENDRPEIAVGEETPGQPDDGRTSEPEFTRLADPELPRPIHLIVDAFGETHLVPHPSVPEGLDDNDVWTALTMAAGMALSVQTGDGLFTMSIDAPDQSFTIESSMLVDPDRIIFDFLGVDEPSFHLAPLQLSHPIVQRMRATGHEGHLRLIVDLKMGVGHRLELTQADAGRAEIVLYRVLHDVAVEGWDGGGRISLAVHRDTPFNIMTLEEPKRWIIDLEETTIGIDDKQLDIDDGFLKAVRMAQHDRDVTRIVLDMDQSVSVDVLREPGGLAIYYGEIQVAPVAYRHLGEDNIWLRVDLPEEYSVTSFRLSGPDRLVFDIEGLTLEGSIPDHSFREGPVAQIRSSQFLDNTVRVVADLRHYVQYDIIEKDGYMIIAMHRPRLAGQKVVIDPGHGGIDSGAVGGNFGVLEKDVNLAIATRVSSLINEAGGAAHLTRHEDVFRDLWSRPEMANEIGADVFVSIHSNSVEVPTPTANGTETYVDMNDEQSLRLGESLQAAVVSAIGTRDRGVRQNRYLVVRHASMPAALVEVGFLSDKDEEARFLRQSFLDSAADGIFNGLLQYFGEELPFNVEKELERDEHADDWTSLFLGS